MSHSNPTPPSSLTCLACSTPLPGSALFCPACGAATPTKTVDRHGSTDSAEQSTQQTETRRRLQAAVGMNYELGELLGQGGFGLVFAAFDRKLKREVAIKALRVELATSETFRERFEREATAAAQLHHPNVIPIYGVGEDAGLVYLIMPRVGGESLRAVLQREGALPLGEALRILREAASALAAAHRAGLIHRDVKPDNIMLEGEERRVLLMDFGIAKAMDPGATQLTGTGMVVGTPHYMSPEQSLAEKELTPASDIYSLGVVAYQMFTGRLPFEGDSAADLMRGHVLTPAPDLRHGRPEVSARLAAIIARCLKKRPAERWPSAQELLKSLNDLGDSLPPAHPWHSTSLRIVVPLLLFLVAAAGYWKWRHTPAVPARPARMAAALYSNDFAVPDPKLEVSDNLCQSAFAENHLILAARHDDVVCIFVPFGPFPSRVAVSTRLRWRWHHAHAELNGLILTTPDSSGTDARYAIVIRKAANSSLPSGVEVRKFGKGSVTELVPLTETSAARPDLSTWNSVAVDIQGDSAVLRLNDKRLGSFPFPDRQFWAGFLVSDSVSYSFFRVTQIP